MRDVLIAGGGLAGSAVAIQLGRLGVSVELFECGHFPTVMNRRLLVFLLIWLASNFEPAFGRLQPPAVAEAQPAVAFFCAGN